MPPPELNSTRSDAADPGPSRLQRRATLPVTMLVQTAASAAVIAPAVAAPRLLEQLQLGPAAVGAYVALVYAAAALSGPVGCGADASLGTDPHQPGGAGR